MKAQLFGNLLRITSIKAKEFKKLLKRDQYAGTLFDEDGNEIFRVIDSEGTATTYGIGLGGTDAEGRMYTVIQIPAETPQDVNEYIAENLTDCLSLLKEWEEEVEKLVSTRNAAAAEVLAMIEQ